MKTVVLNAGKMNYDGAMDLKSLSADVTVYDSSAESEIAARAAGAEILVTKELPMPGRVIEALPEGVRLICEAGTGYNNIDLAACRARGITVCNTPAYSTERVAHTAILMLLSLASDMRRQTAMLTRGDRSNFTEHMKVSHTEVNGKVLGVVGFGHIGGEVAKIALALGMEVLAYSRTEKEVAGVRFVPLDELLSSSDYITLHCPLNDSTRHLIDAAAIGKMKDGACVINTGRGALIDEPALIAALQSGKLFGAGLDVQETEPPAADNPLYTMENVILTPHMGWKGLETRQRLNGILKDNIAAFEKGEPINVVS